MSSYQTIETPQDYVNYTFNISARGVTEVAGEMAGLSNTVTTILGQLAFKTSEYLTHTESLVIGLGTASVAAFASATKEAIKFEQAIANVQAIGGESIDAMKIGQEAMKYSSQFGMDVNSMTEGLEALSRAGLTATNVMSGVLEEGVKLSKLEGMDLEDSINNLISTTNLLSTEDLDINSQEYADAVKAMNQHIVSTSESAPINAENIIQTLQHVGGYASANNIDQEDLFAVIAQLGAKGTKGEMAGTALRAFIAAGQKDQAQRALARVGLNVSDLWDESGEAMLPVSEMKDVIDSALEARGYSKQEKLEFYSDFAGYKQANQIMKIDTSEVKEYKETIAQAWDLGKKLETILGTTHNNLQTLFQTTKNFMTKVGSSILPIINAIIIPIKWGVQLLDKIPFSENITGMLLAFGGIKAVLLLINRVIPTLASMYTSFKGAETKAKGIRGHMHNMLEDIKQSKEILSNIDDPIKLSQIRVEQGLMGEQSYKMHKEITKEIYTDFRSMNPSLPEWDKLENFKQEAISDLMESFKPTDIYQEKQEIKTNQISEINKQLEKFLVGKNTNINKKASESWQPSNIDRNREDRKSNDSQAHQDLLDVRNNMRDMKEIVKNNTENLTQEDIGMGIISVADKLAEIFVDAFNRDKNKKTVNIEDIKVRVDKNDSKQVNDELKQLLAQSRKKDLPDIGFHYDYDLQKLNVARNALIKDINSIATDFANTDLQHINDKQRTRIGKQLSINKMSSRGKRESVLFNEAEIRDIFNKFEKYENDVKYGLIPSVSPDTKNLAFTTDSSTFWVDPNDENKGIRIEQIEALEEALEVKNPSGNRAERIQKILQKYESLSTNERYIKLEKGIYNAKDKYSTFLDKREYPSDIATSHINNSIAKELLNEYNIDTSQLTGTYAEQLQQAFLTLSNKQKAEIEKVLYIDQKRNAQGIYTESEATQLSMMFDKLVMLDNAIAAKQSISRNTNILDALVGLYDSNEIPDLNNIPKDILSYINNGRYFIVTTPDDTFNDYFDNRTDYGEDNSNNYTYSDFERQHETIIQQHADALKYDEKKETAKVRKTSFSRGYKTDLSVIIEPLKDIKDNIQKLAERFVPSSSSLANIKDESFRNIDNETAKDLTEALNRHSNELQKTREFQESFLYENKENNDDEKFIPQRAKNIDDDYIDVKVIKEEDNIVNTDDIFTDTDSVYGILYNKINEVFITKLTQSLTQFENNLQDNILLLKESTQLFLTNNQYISDIIDGFFIMGHLLNNNIKMLPEKIYPNFTLKNDAYGLQEQGNLLQLLDKYSPYNDFIKSQDFLLRVSEVLTEEEDKYLSTIRGQIKGRFYRFAVRNQLYTEPIGPIPQQPTTKTKYAFGATNLGVYEKQYRLLANGGMYVNAIGPQQLYGVKPQLISQKVAQYQKPIEIPEIKTDLDKIKQSDIIKKEQKRAKREQEHQEYIALQAKEEERLIGITERLNKKLKEQKERNDAIAKIRNQRYQDYKREKEELLQLAFAYEFFTEKQKPIQIQSPKGVLQQTSQSAPTGEFTILKQAQFFPGLDNNYYQFLNDIQKQLQTREEKQKKEAQLKYEALIQADKYASTYAQLYPKYINPDYIEQSQIINEKFNPISAFIAKKTQYNASIGPLPAIDYHTPLAIDSHLNGQHEKAQQALQKLKDRRYKQQVEEYGYGPGRGDYYARINDIPHNIGPTFIEQASIMNALNDINSSIEDANKIIEEIRKEKNQDIIDFVNNSIIDNDNGLNYSGKYKRGATIIGNGDLDLDNIQKATDMFDMFDYKNQMQKELREAQKRYRQNKATSEDLILLGIKTPSQIEEERGIQKAKSLERELQGVRKTYARIRKQQEDIREEQEAAKALSVLFDETDYNNRKEALEIAEKLGPQLNETYRHMVDTHKEHMKQLEHEKEIQETINKGVQDSLYVRGVGVGIPTEYTEQKLAEEAQKYSHMYGRTYGVNPEYEQQKATEEQEKRLENAKKIREKIDETNKTWHESELTLYSIAGTLSGVAESVRKLGKLFKPLEILSIPIEKASEKVQDVADVFDMIQHSIGVVKIFNSDMTKDEAEAVGLEDEWRSAAKLKRFFGEDTFMGALLEGMGINITEIFDFGKILMKAIGAQLRAFIIANIGILGPIFAGVAIAVGALWLSEQNHAKALKEATEEQEKARKEASASYITYKNLHEARKNEHDAMKRQQLARKESIALYKLETDRIRQLNAIEEKQKLKNDVLWGEYGLRAELQKQGFPFIGEFESQYEQYEGSTGEIRRIKEDTLGNGGVMTTNQAAVSAWYDAHARQLAQIEAFAPELQELYDLESRLIEKYGSKEAARDSKEFKEAVQEFSDATGLNKETAEKYLDYLQTEANVEHARYAMQAEVDMIVSNAQAEAYKALYGDEAGIGELDSVQDAMVYATADQIFKDAYQELWWSMLMEWLAAIWNQLTLNFGEAQKHAKAAGAYQDGMRELAENQGRITQEGVDIAKEDQRKDYGNESYTSSYGDTPFGGAEASSAAQEQDYAEEEMNKQDMYYNASKANGEAATQGFKDGLDQHSPGKIARSMRAEMIFSKEAIERGGESVMGALYNVSDATASAFSWMGGNANNAFNEVYDATSDVFNIISDGAEWVGGTIFNALTGGSKSIFKGFSESIKKPSNIKIDNSKTEVHIHTVNINTDDDPEKIKTALMELIIEFGDLVTPKQVSRIIGTPPATSASSTENTATEDENAENTENTENSNTNTNNTPTT